MPSINPIRLARTAVTAPARLARATVVTTTRVGVQGVGAVASQVVRRLPVTVPPTGTTGTDAGEAPAQPVNVVEDLDLDPAPVDDTARATSEEPVTAIDASADAEHVEATPADIAARVGHGPGPGPAAG